MQFPRFTTFSPCAVGLLGFILAHVELGKSSSGEISAAQGETGFMGWYVVGSTSVQALTDPETWGTSGDYAAGCDATSSTCVYATACESNTLFYNDGKYLDCNDCQTMTIQQSYPFGTPTATNLFCAQNWPAHTIYREYPTAALSTSSLAVSTVSTINTSSVTVSSTSASTTSSPATSSPPATGHSSSSKAWIAGAVIGTVAASASVAGLIWWFKSREGGEVQAAQHASLVEASNSDIPHPPAPAQELDASEPRAVFEMSSGNRYK
ncbi:hypothetical protein N7450_011476 [Penicillium hetheringtonii]|uniref:Uncharacterized protein n=1 Tax=Penicillium hetheringtonii TaxID=911720 RepID=A0AAD6DA36_9EURO|nr:hypothetical protein N7450_011476 [Penicillium hetheringtonii]